MNDKRPFPVLVIVILICAIMATIVVGMYADWWAFNQKFPHASFWAWVISP
jgi:type II secretory pathway component PulK